MNNFSIYGSSYCMYTLLTKQLFINHIIPFNNNIIENNNFELIKNETKKKLSDKIININYLQTYNTIPIIIYHDIENNKSLFIGGYDNIKFIIDNIKNIIKKKDNDFNKIIEYFGNKYESKDETDKTIINMINQLTNIIQNNKL